MQAQAPSAMDANLRADRIRIVFCREPMIQLDLPADDSTLLMVSYESYPLSVDGFTFSAIVLRLISHLVMSGFFEEVSFTSAKVTKEKLKCASFFRVTFRCQKS